MYGTSRLVEDFVPFTYRPGGLPSTSMCRSLSLYYLDFKRLEWGPESPTREDF